MNSLIQQSISGCIRGAVIPPIAAPIVLILMVPHSPSSFAYFFLSIPIGGAIGLIYLAFIGLPILILLGYLRLNHVWLVALVGFIVGISFVDAPLDTYLGFTGAVTGSVASYFSQPDASLKGKIGVWVTKVIQWYFTVSMIVLILMFLIGGLIGVLTGNVSTPYDQDSMIPTGVSKGGVWEDRVSCTTTYFNT